MNRFWWAVFTDRDGARSADGWFTTREQAEAAVERFFQRASRQFFTAEVRQGNPW